MVLADVCAAAETALSSVVYIEWQNNVLTFLVSFEMNADGEEAISCELQMYSVLYENADEITTDDAIIVPLSLPVENPLWQKAVQVNKEISEYGLQIESVQVEGTKLGEYIQAICTVIDAEKAADVSMQIVRENGEVLDYGFLESVNCSVPSECENGDVHIFSLTAPAESNAPDIIYAAISNGNNTPVVVQIPLD